MTKIMSYLDLGKQEGAQLLIGGERARLPGDLAEGYYVQPTLFKGHNKMRIFQEEIFGPVLAVTTFKDAAQPDDSFFDKAIEGLVLFAFNQGEVCTCPSRALIHESIYDHFMERVLDRVRAIKQGSPLDTDTMMGAQAS